MAAGSIQCRVVTPSGVQWQGTAWSVSSSNQEGMFSILPGHANFISLIQNEVKVRGDGKGSRQNLQAELSFEEGVLICKDDVVSVYIAESRK